MSEERILVGQINGIYGVKGWVKVFSHTEPRSNILKYSPWLLKIKGEWKAFNLLDGQEIQGGKSVVACLEGIDDREIARTFMGTDISILPSQLETSDEYYWRDLIGCDVINQDSVLLGKVTELVETGVHDVLRVVSEQASDSILIPFVFENFIVDVDIEAQKIQVDWELEETLDENASETELNPAQHS